MPNWCEDSLTITGKPSERAMFERVAARRKTPSVVPDEAYAGMDPVTAAANKFVDAMTEETGEPTALTFTAFVPPPATYNNDWCVEHWGTKWDACDVNLTRTPRTTHYWFQTAWSPPEEAVLAMSLAFPDLKFTLRYWEGGMGFQGKLVLKGGKVIENICTDYSGTRGG